MNFYIQCVGSCLVLAQVYFVHRRYAGISTPPYGTFNGLLIKSWKSMLELMKEKVPAASSGYFPDLPL